MYYITRGVKLRIGENSNGRNTELHETNPLIDFCGASLAFVHLVRAGQRLPALGITFRCCLSISILKFGENKPIIKWCYCLYLTMVERECIMGTCGLVKESYLWVQGSVTHLQLPLVCDNLAIPHSWLRNHFCISVLQLEGILEVLIISNWQLTIKFMAAPSQGLTCMLVNQLLV